MNVTLFAQDDDEDEDEDLEFNLVNNLDALFTQMDEAEVDFKKPRESLPRAETLRDPC